MEEKVEFLFDAFKEDCPAYSEGYCLWQPYYNRHVNDMHCRRCAVHSCAPYYWASVAIGE